MDDLSARSAVKILFVAQRFDRIELRGFARRVKTEEDTDGRAEEKRDHNRSRSRSASASSRMADKMLGRADPADDSNDAADRTERHRFDQELSEDVAAVRADGHADTDFARPFSHAHEHDVHDSDSADHQRDARDCAQQNRHHVATSPWPLPRSPAECAR